MAGRFLASHASPCAMVPSCMSSIKFAEDAQVAAVARGEGRAVITENVADFAAERDVVLVFVLKKNLPSGGGQAAALAKILDRWAQQHPDPYLGPHWPST